MYTCIKVQRVLEKLKDTIDLVNTKSQTGSSGGSRRTSSSLRSLQKFETAKVKLKIAEQATELKRQKLKLEYEEKMRAAELEKRKADIDLEIDLMKTKEEHEAAQVEHQVHVGMEPATGNHNPSLDLPNSSAEERTSTFIKGLRNGEESSYDERSRESEGSRDSRGSCDSEGLRDNERLCDSVPQHGHNLNPYAQPFINHVRNHNLRHILSIINMLTTSSRNHKRKHIRSIVPFRILSLECQDLIATRITNQDQIYIFLVPYC
jgi:hypothetical protein